jgi:shikimate dehydrogenase
LPAADVDDFLAFAGAIGLQGASVTIPYKVPLMARTSGQDETVRRVGALNTLRRDGSGWSARNTDVAGFLRPLLERGIRLADARVSLLGAGGSARAVAMGLTNLRARVTIHARDSRKASAVAEEVGAAVGDWPPESGAWDLLVNCTPVGMHPVTDRAPVAFTSGPPGVVYDLIYNPPLTRLLREAQQAGHRTIGGLDMLVAQAEEQFEWWTGQRPPAGVMEAAARARLAEFNADENHFA